MDAVLFEDLVQSLKEARAISKGEIAPSRRFKVELIDVKAIREKLGLSQADFAKLVQVSVKTLRNWEQLRNAPTGPAAALLKLISTEPELALRTLHE